MQISISFESQQIVVVYTTKGIVMGIGSKYNTLRQRSGLRSLRNVGIRTGARRRKELLRFA